MPMTSVLTIGPHEAFLAAIVGLIAGMLGGLLGIGGSIVMIPGLAVAFHSAGSQTQHLFQASSMAINFAVAVPAAMTHARAGAVRKDLLTRMLPFAMVAIVLGVIVSNQLDGGVLRKLFAAFLLYVAAVNIVRTVRRKPDHQASEARITWPRCGLIGVVMGFAAGVLGIGGGILTIPLIQTVCRAPLRQCIGATSATMCFTAAVGASLRIGTISQHGFTPEQALAIAAILAPTAVGASWAGARLTHKLPTAMVRGALVLVMILSAWGMWRLASRSAAAHSAPPAASSFSHTASQPITKSDVPEVGG